MASKKKILTFNIYSGRLCFAIGDKYIYKFFYLYFYPPDLQESDRGANI